MFTVALVVWLALIAGGFVVLRWRSIPLRHPDRAAALLSWLALVAAVVMGVAPLVPPGVDGNPDGTAFSVDRAREHIQVVAQQPHPVGSPAIVEAREYVVSELRELDLNVEFQTLEVLDYYGPGRVDVVNVLARIEGSESTGALALVAHVDTVPWTSGANDNTSGVAILLESARHLVAGGALRNDVVLVFSDGEEPAPRFGSTAFVADHRWVGDVRFVVNLEAIGTGGPSLLTEMGGPPRWVLDRYVAAVPHPAAFSFLTETTELIGGSNTDFAPFRDEGIAGVEFVYAHGSPIYHTAADRPDRVSERSLQAHGANTLAIATELGRVDLSRMDGDQEMVFFTIGGNRVIRYSASWAALPVVLAGIALAGAVVRRRRWRAVAGRAAVALGVAVVVSCVLTGVWVVLAGWRDSMGIAESYAYLFVLAGLVAVALIVPFPWRAVGLQPVQADEVVLVWWVLAVLTTLVVPGFSYLFAWPALTGALALHFRSGDRAWRSWVSATVTLGVAAVVLVPAIDTFYQFAQPRPGNPGSEILWTVAVPLVLVASFVQLARALHDRSVHSGPAGIRVDQAT